jgi:hypothetical protein
MFEYWTKDEPARPDDELIAVAREDPSAFGDLRAPFRGGAALHRAKGATGGSPTAAPHRGRLYVAAVRPGIGALEPRVTLRDSRVLDGRW